MRRHPDDVPAGGSADTATATTVSDARRVALAAGELAAGTVLDRYVIVGRLGEGGMGVVYAAQDPELDRRIAIKLLRGPGATGGRERLQREAQAMARLSHPAVVPVFDVGVHGQQLFVAMELVDGQTLRQWLREHRPGWRQALAMLLDAGSGLAAAHGAGIVHRDFKPDNVLVGRAGRVRVTDFGLALLDADSAPTPARGPGSQSPAPITRAGAIMGTPAYMAPEQHMGRPVGPAADQFSFCVAVYEALYAQHPFLDESVEQSEVPTTMALAGEVTGGRVRPPPRGSQVPARVQQALLRGLAVDPLQRWPHMDDLLGALEQAAARRRRWPWAVAATAVAVLGVAAGVWWLRPRPPAPMETPAAVPAGLLQDVEPGSVRRLTFADGCEENPAVAPDGRTIYYDGAVGQDYRIFRIDRVTRDIAELTHTHGWDMAPAPSPDGKRLAFLRRTEDAAGAYVADLSDLEHARRIGGGGLRPAWSPDGRQLWTGNSSGIVRTDPATGEVSRRLMPPTGERPLIGIELPDGRFVLLVTRADGTAIATGVAVYAVDAPAPRWLVHDIVLDEVLTLAPQGDAVIVASITATQSIELIQVPLDGSPSSHLAGAGINAHKRLALSPDGTVLAWSDCVDRTGLAVLQTTGGPPRLTDLAPGRWSDIEPAALPGTDELLFLSDRGGDVGLWRMAPHDPGHARPIPLGGLEPNRVAASPDGKQLAISDSHTGLFITPIAGSASPRLLVREEGELNPSFDRTNRLIYFERDDHGQLRVARVAVAGGPPTWALPPATFAPAASPTADELAYLSGDLAGAHPMLLDQKTGRTRPLLAAEPPQTWRNLHFSPDGSRLVLISPNTRLLELDLATDRPLRDFTPGTDGFLGATFLGPDIIAARTGWTGDLWTGRRSNSIAATTPWK